ncbi:hypothetical protein TMU3MR103_1031 [Tetragenococcus muriaticus 3MR10-3]|uniref:Uncharacterized protein n=1 Tax=Tetragenococcus muriaticus 3MR10-3 TaxID=1302648 RepID=A0A091C5R9_9ENTE|nr:hypothetical protein TMU3MR103_1031 [Tetragenococcus muriaticus 3MR10-3]
MNKSIPQIGNQKIALICILLDYLKKYSVGAKIHKCIMEMMTVWQRTSIPLTGDDH